MRRRKGLESTIGSHGTTIKHNRCLLLLLHLFSILDQHTPEYLNKTIERFMTPLSLRTPANSHKAPVISNDDVLSHKLPVTLSPLKIHSVHYENGMKDLCHSIGYEARPNSEPVDIVLSPSPTPMTSDLTNAQSSPDESKPLHTKPLLKEHKGPRPPPVIPPKDPHRGPEKRTWLSKLCIKVIRMLNLPGTGQDRKKPRHTKEPQRRKENSAVRRRRGGGGAAFGGATFVGAGAACGGAAAAGCGGGCGC